jgi:hypothetical protein
MNASCKLINDNLSAPNDKLIVGEIFMINKELLIVLITIFYYGYLTF